MEGRHVRNVCLGKMDVSIFDESLHMDAYPLLSDFPRVNDLWMISSAHSGEKLVPMISVNLFVYRKSEGYWLYHKGSYTESFNAGAFDESWTRTPKFDCVFDSRGAVRIENTRAETNSYSRTLLLDSNVHLLRHDFSLPLYATEREERRDTRADPHENQPPVRPRWWRYCIVVIPSMTFCEVLVVVGFLLSGDCGYIGWRSG